jgi:polyhydroxybutyrate depolymerase
MTLVDALCASRLETNLERAMIACSARGAARILASTIFFFQLGGQLFASEIHAGKISVDDHERDFLLSMPAPSGPHPAVVVLHGGSLDAKNAMRSTGFEPLVDREPLVAVYPNASAGHWNDGRTSAHWSGSSSDDVAFIRALIAELVRTGTLDPHRVYLTGPSNGGMMTFRLVCEASELFAAAAPIIASMPADLASGCKPARPTPILVMDATADPLVPYGGGEVGFRGERGRVLSTAETIALLRNVNRCSGGSSSDRLPDSDPADGSNVDVIRWTDCSSHAPVVLYRINGGGHRIPRQNEGPRPVVDRLLGRANHDFEAAEAIWAFFKDKKR